MNMRVIIVGSVLLLFIPMLLVYSILGLVGTSPDSQERVTTMVTELALEELKNGTAIPELTCIEDGVTISIIPPTEELGTVSKGLTSTTRTKLADGQVLEVTYTANNRFSLLYVLLIPAFSVYGGWGMWLLQKKISEPVEMFVRCIQHMAVGDFGNAIVVADNIHSKQLQQLGTCMETMRVASQTVIADITSCLTSMADGDFTASITHPEAFVGDYGELVEAQDTISSNISTALSGILDVSEQVNSTAGIVSNTAQSLAQGATEQAGAIDGLSLTISSVVDNINKTAENTGRALAIVKETEEAMDESVAGINKVRSAMEEINLTSHNISKVIKDIDDIAFQTNILALNAAVEAARAGAAGKGFAVVADEVRNLAQKSAESAKNTASMIEKSIEAAENGQKLTTEATDVITNVAAKSAEISDVINLLNAEAAEEVTAIGEIKHSIEQVSTVVQMNSATSEESAAASEELSMQAGSMRSLIEHFRVSGGAQE